MCHAFPCTLKRTPYQWFDDLLVTSVSQFSELAWLLVAQYVGVLRIKKGNDSLFLEKQEEDTL